MHSHRIRGTTTLWLSLVIWRKMAGRANSNDLEIPGGEKSHIYFLRLRFQRKKILNVTPSWWCISVRGKLDTDTKNRRCHWKIQIWLFWISLYGLFICYCFQIICHFQMRNKVWQGFSGLTGFNRKILVTCTWLSM